VRINDRGELILNLGTHEIVQNQPVTYQLDAVGGRVEIGSGYTIRDDVVGFKLASYDPQNILVIDPVLEYSAYYGGTGHEIPIAVDLDAMGNIYVIGESSSAGLATVGAFLENNQPQRSASISFPSCADCTDGSGQVERHHITRLDRSILITKFSPDGSSVLATTYFNSAQPQTINLGVNSAAVSASGEVSFGISGIQAGIGGLPLVNETQAHSATEISQYIAKLNSAGNALVFGTYLHTGSITGWVRGLDVASDGTVAAVGMLSSDNSFPEVNAIIGQSCTLNAGIGEFTDGWLIQFSPTGTVEFASCLGGETRDGASYEGLRGLAIGDNGHLYAVGYSSMTDFPMVNPIQATKNVAGAREMTISQVDPDTGTLVFSTWFGPTSASAAPRASGAFLDFFPIDIKADSSGNIIVTGVTNSLSYPTVNAFQTNRHPLMTYILPSWTR